MTRNPMEARERGNVRLCVCVVFAVRRCVPRLRRAVFQSGKLGESNRECEIPGERSAALGGRVAVDAGY